MTNGSRRLRRAGIPPAGVDRPLIIAGIAAVALFVLGGTYGLGMVDTLIAGAIMWVIAAIALAVGIVVAMQFFGLGLSDGITALAKLAIIALAASASYLWGFQFRWYAAIVGGALVLYVLLMVFFEMETTESSIVTVAGLFATVAGHFLFMVSFLVE